VKFQRRIHSLLEGEMDGARGPDARPRTRSTEEKAVFLSNSRYAGLPTATVPLADGREATVVRLRRLPVTAGVPYAVRGQDRLDIIAQKKYEDPTRYWHAADANTELEAADLTATAGRVIQVPEH
jgi:hypothetical protein